MLVDIIAGLILIYLTIPAVSGYCAVSYGKKFWPWFFYGLFFPGVAHFHLFILLHLEDKKAQKEFQMSREELKHMEKMVRETLEQVNARFDRTRPKIKE